MSYASINLVGFFSLRPWGRTPAVWRSRQPLEKKGDWNVGSIRLNPRTGCSSKLVAPLNVYQWKNAPLNRIQRLSELITHYLQTLHVQAAYNVFANGKERLAEAGSLAADVSRQDRHF